VFLLEKWYGDVVTAQGAGAIVYAARLRWGPLRFGYGATIVFTGADPPRASATVRGVGMPRLESEVATWRHAALHADARWCRDAAPLESCLADGPDGSIRWNCHMPRAVARVQIGDAILHGLGYVEQLQLTIPPAKLPFRGGSLRWGRYLSPQHAIVWIEWTGANPRHWAWLDGVGQTGLANLDGGRRLVFHESRAIRDQPLLTTIRLPSPHLARRLTGVLDAAREHKRVSRAALVKGDDATPLDEGWAIHEEVLW
jgi:hypothetical protein